MVNAVIENDDFFQQHGIMRPLNTDMKVELVFGKNGTFSILHSARLPYILKWVEFEPEQRSFVFVSQEGYLQPLGMKVPEKIMDRLDKLDELAVMHVEGGKVADLCLVPLMKPSVTWN
ncbi:MAG: hypothetical protein QF692_01060 [Alphaproteobacteria bacterium]|jgi:hypothetical protein|nr:hypothetical protein [Alphaproteobacteria bacterium]MDP7221832.1 hypothetical protein [Alphaproteobacteria bacterium]